MSNRLTHLFDQDLLDTLLSGRFLNPKFFIDLPDGVYDNHQYQTRDVVYKNYSVRTCTKIWLDNGGPDDWPIEITSPKFGDFPDVKA